MKRAAAIIGLAYLWTFIASMFFCVFNFQLWRFPFLQWWVGLYYLRNMLWLPRIKDIGHWPIFWFVVGFVVASLFTFLLARQLWATGKNRQPNLYGTSKFAGIKAAAEGGIITEKRR